MYNNILVAIDGSPTSDLALHEGINLASVGSKIIIVTVVESPLIGYYIDPVAVYDYTVIHDTLLQQSEDILVKARQDIQHRSDIHVETHIIDMHSNNDVALAIYNAAKAYHADLIVIGTHGRQGVKRFFLGSVAEQVIRQSQLPVLVIRNQSGVLKT